MKGGTPDDGVHPGVHDDRPFNDASRRFAGAERGSPGGSSPSPRRPRVVSVAQLTRDLKHAVESVFFNCNVEGEVNGVKRAGRGHTYFTLKDDWAQISCVIWAKTAARLPFRISDGMRVVAHGDVQIYEKHGRYQLVIRQLAEAGLGAHLLALERLKRQLHAEGLFDPASKRALPGHPRRIGVVTAEGGAALRDILATIRRRFPTSVLVAPCRVQGPEAVPTIEAALRNLQAVDGVDVIILSRGGGSVEDLRAFNDERVVRAVADCSVPVVSGVGHEVDQVLTDLAADVRAATPTAAAELVVADQRPLRRRLAHSQQRLDRAAERLLAERQQRVDLLLARLGPGLRDHTGARARRLADLRGRLANLHPRSRVSAERSRLTRLQERALGAMTRQLTRRRQRLATLTRTLEALSPQGNLDRGYAIVRTGDDGRVVASASDAKVGDGIEVMLQNGTLWATVTGVEHSEKDPGE